VTRWSLFSCVLVSVALLCGCPSKPSPTSASASATAPAPPAPPLPPAPGANTPKSFADLAEKADAAVVFVKTLQEQKGRTGRRRVINEGLGSAFVYDASGLILTNNHVIENATDIRVVISKKEMKATVVGRDPPTDIAILRVDQKGLTPLPLGDSDAVRVGDWAVAIGNPFGLSHTVSAGIISAKERTGQDVKGLGDGSGYYNFIQTDASINPGNSGGPLLDMAGRVIGINTAIRARANNIGFAIPINMVKELVPRLISDGRVKRSAIGITVSSVTEEDAARLGLPNTNGALIRAVIPGGAADKAGLQVDDVVSAFEGEAIPSPEKLRWMASVAGSGKNVSLKVARGKRTFDMKVTLGDLPDQPLIEQPDDEPDDPFGGGGPP
jgi:serine protease Do